MTVGPDFDRLFAEGHAQLLIDAGLGLTRGTSDGGIQIPRLDPDSPADGVAVWITPYPLADDPALSDSTVGLQIGVRATGYADTVGMHDRITDSLLGRWSYVLPTGITVSTLVRSSTVPATREPSGRRRWSTHSNWTALTYRPSPHRQ